MKKNMESTRKNREDTVSGAGKSSRAADEPEAFTKVAIPGHLRRLKGNEMVSHGDFVADESLGFVPWEGPRGFRADAFVKAIYRRKKTRRLRTTATRKSRRMSHEELKYNTRP